MMLNNTVITQGNIGADDYVLHYNNDIDLLIKELRRREKETIRPVVSTNALTFLTEKDLLNHKYQVKNIANKSRLFLKIEDIVYPVSENAFISIRGRIEIYGKGLLELPDNLLRDVLNNRIKQYSQVRIIVIDEKIRAIFSANRGGYKVIPTIDIVEETINALNAKFVNSKFHTAYLTYDILYLKLLFPEKKETLQDLYGKEKTYIPGVLVATSDTGFSANAIYPIWQLNNKSSAVMGNPEETIRMVHRGKDANISSLQDDIPNIFLKLKDNLNLMKKHSSTVIRYPSIVIDKMGKKLKLSKKDVRLLQSKLQLFKFKNPDIEDITAFNLITFLSEIISDTKNENKKRQLEISTGKAFNLNYKKLDNID